MSKELTTQTKSDQNTHAVDWKDHLAGWVAVGAVTGFIIFVTLLAILLISSPFTELQWGRYTYLLTGIETITFTAIGWLFGKEVHRREAQEAEKQVKDAKQEVQETKSFLALATNEAAHQAARASEEEMKGHTLSQAIQRLRRSADIRHEAIDHIINVPSLHERVGDYTDMVEFIDRITLGSELKELFRLADTLYPDGNLTPGQKSRDAK